MAESVEVLVTGSVLPHYAHAGDAGADLQSTHALVLAPGARALVSTGVSIALPGGFAAFVVPRSGLAIKHGITIVNSPGTVDAGYRGEIKVILLNTDQVDEFRIEVGDRIAQLIVMPVARANFIAVEHLPGSQRGAGGFGSTGIAAPAPAIPHQDTPNQATPNQATPNQASPNQASPNQAMQTGGAL